jgi:Ca2+/Na+ antiporter
MAVANALGSNIFDIGICLGLPWIIYLAITQAPVPVSNGDLTISIATLMGVLVLVVGTFLITKFRINKTV